MKSQFYSPSTSRLDGGKLIHTQVQTFLRYIQICSSKFRFRLFLGASLRVSTSSRTSDRLSVLSSFQLVDPSSDSRWAMAPPPLSPPRLSSRRSPASLANSLTNSLTVGPCAGDPFKKLSTPYAVKQKSLKVLWADVQLSRSGLFGRNGRSAGPGSSPPLYVSDWAQPVDGYDWKQEAVCF